MKTLLDEIVAKHDRYDDLALHREWEGFDADLPDGEWEEEFRGRRQIPRRPTGSRPRFQPRPRFRRRPPPGQPSRPKPRPGPRPIRRRRPTSYYAHRRL